MGGRNGGEMGKTTLEMEKNGKKSRAVKRPRKNSDEAATARGSSKQNAEAKKPGKAEKKATKKIEKKKRKGAKKALRHAVQREVKEKCGKIAEGLVSRTQNGDMRSADMVMALMEKKKKKAGEGNVELNGPTLAEQLAGPSWDELQEAKRIVSEKEAKTQAA
jgi:hypothetical protein